MRLSFSRRSSKAHSKLYQRALTRKRKNTIRGSPVSRQEWEWHMGPTMTTSWHLPIANPELKSRQPKGRRKPKVSCRSPATRERWQQPRRRKSWGSWGRGRKKWIKRRRHWRDRAGKLMARVVGTTMTMEVKGVQAWLRLASHSLRFENEAKKLIRGWMVGNIRLILFKKLSKVMFSRCLLNHNP